MKFWLFILFLLFIPAFLYGHPGKTDYRGGHKCWKNCGQWELANREYHLHDREGKTIRLESRNEPAKAVQSGRVPVPDKYFLQEELPAEPESAGRVIEKEDDIKERQAVIERHETVTIYREAFLPFYAILLILAFLLLIFLVFREREKSLKKQLIAQSRGKTQQKTKPGR
jgi:hypothetical protein